MIAVVIVQREKRRKELLEKAEEKRKLEEELLKKALEDKAKTLEDGKTEVVVVLPDPEKENTPATEVQLTVVQDEGSESGSSGASTPLEPPSTQWITLNDGSGW